MKMTVMMMMQISRLKALIMLVMMMMMMMVILIMMLFITMMILVELSRGIYTRYRYFIPISLQIYARTSASTPSIKMVAPNLVILR